MIVKITDADRRGAKYEAEQLVDYANSTGKQAYLGGTVTENYIGKLGEIAFRKFLDEKGVLFKELKYNGNEWDKCDFVISDKLIDVKSTEEASYKKYMMIPKPQFENKKKDFYVSIVVNQNHTNANVQGFMDYERIKALGFKKFGAMTYPAYCVHFDSLVSMDDFLKETGKNFCTDSSQSTLSNFVTPSQ